MILSQIHCFNYNKVSYQYQISKTLLYGYSNKKTNRTFHLQTPKLVGTQLILGLFFQEHQNHPQYREKVEFQHNGSIKESLLVTLMVLA